jgi:superfamily II DNA/RNA helicase
MTHHVFEVATPEAKTELVRTLASGTGRRILFMRSKHHAKKLAKQLTEAGIPSVDLHGNLSQPQRDRNLAAFSDGSANVLVATDVAARGVHVDNVELVIHVDPPTEHKAYLHRSGRTARAGSEGDVVTISLPVQRRDLAQLLRKAAIQVTPQQVTATSPAVTELVGDVAPYVKPQPKQVQQQGGGGRSQGANAQRKRANRGGRGAGVGAAAAGTAGTDAGSGRPRRDRSGRPAAAGQGAGQGQSRGQGESRGQQGGRGQRERSQGSSSHASGSQQPRTGGSGRTGSTGGSGRSGGAGQPGRSGGLRVGSLVGGNGGTSRGRGSRRAQG